jgi:alkanesulfonate monooxygenase SsuD/methylene tetrahydromethanopterin reductase-like flavin-dependent oxidoreductase (luciferase family)
MRIGINVPLKDSNERPITAAEAAERARMIESAGLDGIWLGGGGGRGFARVDTMMLLLAAAGATTRVELGTSIYVVSNRHPVEMAHDFVSIESLHPGRFTIGVGAGSGRGGEPYGYDFEGRFKRLHSHMRVIREICDGAALSELSDPEFVQPAPEAPARRFGTPGSGVSLGVEVGGPRFVLGAWHSQISLERSVREYDGWMCSAGRTNFNTMADAIKRYRDLGGTRAMIGTCLVNLQAPTEKITDDDSYYLQCSPEEARDRVGRLEELGFDDLLLVKADYPRKMGLYEADFTVADLEEIRALIPRDERQPITAAGRGQS